MNRSRRDERIGTICVHNKGFRQWIRTLAWKSVQKNLSKSRFSVFTTLPILKIIFRQKFKNLMAIFIFMAMISSKTQFWKKSIWLLYSVKSLLFGCFWPVYFLPKPLSLLTIEPFEFCLIKSKRSRQNWAKGEVWIGLVFSDNILTFLIQFSKHQVPETRHTIWSTLKGDG